ncbi:FAD-dependent oxidoreductase [Methylotetracoccus oryzae]|uniref:FAD-dependent oxidoreductase n=1 Tax=Methylotetracoccus oryzae TaxID=1919059 RepID=UPI001119E95E|nr:bifunctional TVP38/TMEM64 family protein/FAD-dependent oxidoreductase [Methylotetracoccus oryzae]
MQRSRLLVFLVAVACVAAFFALGLDRLLTLEALHARQAAAIAYREAHPLLAAGAYAAIYVVVTGLSLPGATVLTLAGGALFGLLWGTVIVSFASTIGATLAFLGARFLFRDAVQAHFGERMQTIDAGMARDGLLYLFTLRLVPLFPFFMINLLMGLTAMRPLSFAAVSQLGMLAGTVVYVNAGTQLAQLDSLAGVLSPRLLFALALLGVFPLFARRAVDLLRARRVYRGWSKPARFDRNVVVIGAGSGGLVSAYLAAALQARVTLIEKQRMGGDCLNTGCVPSKALIRTARLLAQIQQAPRYGIRRASADFDFATAMERVQDVVRAIAPHDSMERYAELGVEVIQGAAQIVSPWAVSTETECGRITLTTRNIIVAAGARPVVPPLPGLAEAGYLTSDTIWDLRTLPERLLVLGGGPIGCELAQCFARFGSRVSIVELAPQLMVREDPEVSESVAGHLQADGVELYLRHRALRVINDNGTTQLVADRQGTEIRIPFDAVLVAVGRIANTTGYGLETLGIPTSARDTIEVNEFLQTRYPNIYACGDVAGPFQFTHAAAHQAWYAVVNALFGSLRRFRTDYSTLPYATFTDPEIARVGLNEQEALARGIRYEITRYPLKELDRAIIDSVADGFVKVLTAPGRDRILGVTIVGEHAGELIAEFVMAMKHGIGLNKLLGTVHIYPTLSEANKYAAGVWKRAHAPARLLRWIKGYQAWLRG